MLTAYETGIAFNLAQFLALTGALYKAGGLYGYVDVGMAVTGIKGAVSSHRLGQPIPSTSIETYQDEAALRSIRCNARELSEDPLGLVRRLTGRLMRALYGGNLDPLASN
jgi:hypothetical protein